MAFLRAVRDSFMPGDPPPEPSPLPSAEAVDGEVAQLKREVRHEGAAVAQCARALGRVLERTPVERMGEIIDLVERGGRRA